ncbi:hypothetical protein BZG36_01230 [Bifiguratus adelaidae]|uniref:Uncharacterized protein n=1 Tax=Bifiguratus adelaidae TaxID=1938954 RepID=A0A261Y5U1_9FUNG|nr:hypothetical protein BZG36_01230 [Bifiguratus adelaidae]
MSKPRVLICGSLRFAYADLAKLQEKYEIEHMTSKSREEFFEDCKGKYEGISVIYRHPDSQRHTGPFNKELIDHLPKSLKFVCLNGAGYDAIDVNAAAERGIYMSNTPGAVDAGTADITVILLLMACRNIRQSMDALRDGRWNNGVSMGRNPEGKVLGILGMGGIGKAVAERLAGFGMTIQYHNRKRVDPEVEKQYNVNYVDFDTLLTTSDIISLNLPLNKNTRHIISTKEFAKMKDGVIIINTARGAVIDETALVKAMEAGKEPKIHPGLLQHPQAILLPHIGTNTKESQLDMEQLTLSNVDACLSSGNLITPVAEHKKFFPSSRL